jgi:hypothetical protein
MERQQQQQHLRKIEGFRRDAKKDLISVLSSPLKQVMEQSKAFNAANDSAAIRQRELFSWQPFDVRRR